MPIFRSYARATCWVGVQILGDLWVKGRVSVLAPVVLQVAAAVVCFLFFRPSLDHRTDRKSNRS